MVARCQRNVRFTPNGDRKSGHTGALESMSANGSMISREIHPTQLKWDKKPEEYGEGYDSYQTPLP